MPRPREEYPLTKHTLNLYEGQYERLQAIYGSRTGAAKIIRDLITAHLRRIDQRVERTLATQQ